MTEQQHRHSSLSSGLQIWKPSVAKRLKKTDKTWVASKINNYKEKKRPPRWFYFLFLMDAKQPQKKTHKELLLANGLSEDNQIWTSLEVSRL
jgi:hypothetical protein